MRGASEASLVLNVARSNALNMSAPRDALTLAWRAARSSCPYSSTAQRDLHSFPTRRSSDLGKLDVIEQAVDFRAPDMGDKLAQLTTDERGTSSSSDLERSEEHTSELQSQSNIVCRPLLEKKKTKICAAPARLASS